MVKLSDIIAPTYMEIWKDMLCFNHNIYSFTGGRCSGKSSLIALRIIYEMVRDQNACALVMMAYANNLQGSVVEQIKWAISMLELDDYFEYKKSPLTLTYKPTKSKIIFKGLDNSDKLKGIKLPLGKYFKFLWVDEASMLKNYTQIRQVQLSVSRDQPKDIKMQLLLSTNPPKSFNNWFNIWTRDKRKDVMYKHTSYLDIPKEWVSQTFLDEAEYVKSHNEIEYKYVFLGEPVKNEGQFFKNLDFCSFSYEDYKTFDHYNVGLDFGISLDPSVIMLCNYNSQTKTLSIFGEKYFNSGDPDVIHHKMKELSEEFPWCNLMSNKSIFCDCDGIGKPITAQLSKLNLGVIPAIKGPNSRTPRYQWLQSRNKIIIDNEKCPNAAKEFSEFAYKQVRDGRYIEDIPDGNDHTIDSIGYAMSLHFKEDNKMYRPLIPGKAMNFGNRGSDIF